jgi:hypothetical protein
MRNIVDVSAFTDPITLPENGEPVAAEVRDASFQGLANRTRNLKDRADGVDIYVGANDSSRTVRVGAHRSAQFGTWTESAAAVVALTSTRGTRTFDVSAGDGVLPWKGTCTQVQVQAKPGATRADPADQMRATLYRVEADPTVVVQVGSVELAANSSALQLITLPAGVTINGEAVGGNNHRLIVVVESGSDAGATNDAVYDARFTVTTVAR